MRSLEERRTAFGRIYKMNPCPVLEDKKIWDVKHHCWDYEFFDSTTDFFRNIDFVKDGKGERFRIGYCQSCLNKITSYNEKYYLNEYEYNNWTSFELSEQTHFCKDCAEKLSDRIINHGWNPALAIADRYETMINDQWVEITEYCDGSLVEEMTTREFQKCWR